MAKKSKNNGSGEPKPPAPETPKEEAPAIITLNKELRYYFDTGDKLRLGDEMAAAVEQMAEIEEDKKEYMASIKDRLSKVEAVITSNGRKLRQGWELRMIECSMVKDFDTNSVKITRNDTGEVVEERAMTIQERQRELELGAPPATEEELAERMGVEGGTPPPPGPEAGTHEELGGARV